MSGTLHDNVHKSTVNSDEMVPWHVMHSDLIEQGTSAGDGSGGIEPIATTSCNIVTYDDGTIMIYLPNGTSYSL